MPSKEKRVRVERGLYRIGTEVAAEWLAEHEARHRAGELSPRTFEI